MNEQGFTAKTWKSVKVWTGVCATQQDVDAGVAVFALGDTENGRPMNLTLPQPVIWYDEDEEFAALVVQAEIHEADNGEMLEALGLLLPDGRSAIGFLEDVELVEPDDAVWISLIEAELETDDGLNGFGTNHQ